MNSRGDIDITPIFWIIFIIWVLLLIRYGYLYFTIEDFIIIEGPK